MPRKIPLSSSQAHIRADGASDRAKVDYRPVYAELRSTPSIAGLTDLVRSMKENALKLKEVAQKLQSI